MTGIRVTKYDGRGRIIVQTQVATLSQAHTFLDAQPAEYAGVDVSPRAVAADTTPRAAGEQDDPAEATVPG